MSPLRLPHRNDANITKICNLWTFWPVIQPINNLFEICQKAFFWSSNPRPLGLETNALTIRPHGLLSELKAKMSTGCRFLLFQRHPYEVTLIEIFCLARLLLGDFLHSEQIAERTFRFIITISCQNHFDFIIFQFDSN